MWPDLLISGTKTDINRVIGSYYLYRAFVH